MIKICNVSLISSNKQKNASTLNSYSSIFIYKIHNMNLEHFLLNNSNSEMHIIIIFIYLNGCADCLKLRYSIDICINKYIYIYIYIYLYNQFIHFEINHQENVILNTV